MKRYSMKIVLIGFCAILSVLSIFLVTQDKTKISSLKMQSQGMEVEIPCITYNDTVFADHNKMVEVFDYQMQQVGEEAFNLGTVK